MTRKPPGGRSGKRLIWALLPVVAVAGVAIAQIPPDEDAPPTRQGRNADPQNYDPEPYYVDGVEFRPYVPEGARKATNRTETRPVAPATVPATRGVAAGQPVATATPDAPAPVVTAPVAKSAVDDGADETAAVEAPKVPAKRQRHGAAIIQALDKVTAETVRFEAQVGKPVRYKGLIYTIKACETTTPEEAQSDIVAYMEVQSSPQITETTRIMPKPKSIFRGWTYASSPGLNGLQHPVYDAWVISCRAPLAKS